MSDQSYRLLYDLQVQGLDKLTQISSAQKQAAIDAKYGADALKLYSEGLANSAKKVGSVSEALRQMVQEGKQAEREWRTLTDLQKEYQLELKDAMNFGRFARDMQEYYRLQRQEIKATQRAEEQASEQRERGAISAIRTSSILAGVHNTRSIDSTLGAVGGPVGIAGMIGTAVGGGAYNLVKDAAGQARELQNLANEFGLTAQQAFKLDAAAKLSGESLNSMGRLATRLAEALENPGTTGKKTADELIKLGVDLRQGMGGTLEQIIEKLAAIPDAGKRAQEAIVIFGAQGAKIAEIAGEFDSVGQKLDQGVHQKLLEANKALADLGNTWTIVKGQLAAPIVVTFQILQKLSDRLDALTGATLETDAGYQAWTKPGLDKDMAAARARIMERPEQKYRFGGAPAPGVLDPANLAAANRIANRYQDQGLALDERISAARKEAVEQRGKYDRLYATAKGNPGLVGDDELQKEARNVANLEAAYKKLADQKKATSRTPGVENRFDALMRKFAAEDYKAQYPSSQYGRIPELQMQLQSDLGDINKRDSGYTAQQRTIATAAVRRAANRAIIEEARRVGNLQFNDQAHAEAVSNAFNDFAPGYDAKRLDTFYRYDLKDSLEGANKSFAADREIAGINRNAGVDSLRRSVGFQQRLSTMANEGRETGGTIGQGLQGELQIIQAEAQMRKQALQDSDSLYTADQKRVELAKIEADLRKQTADAELSATEKYIQMRYEAQQRNKEETGNFLAGLVNSGIDGRTGDFFRSFGRSTLSTITSNFGKNLPFTLNSALTLGKTGALGTEDSPNFLGKLLEGTPLGFDHGKGANPLQSATDKNTQATVDNTNTLRALMGAPALPGGSGSGVLTAGSGTGAGGIGSIFSGIPGLSGVTGTPPFLPSFLTNSGDGLPIASGPQLSLPGIGGTASSASKGTLAQIFGGLGSTVGNGQGLSALFKGSADLGNGVGHVFSGMERLGAGIGVAGTAAGGIMGAISGFGSGGGRGISSGIGSILGSAAALDPEPLSKSVLGIGAAISGIVSSLFKDPKQARQEEMQKAMINSAFVLPSSNEVTASYGGYSSGGFNYGSGGMVGAANQNTVAPVTIHINAVDSKSLADLFMANPDAMGKGLLYGLQSGSANAFVQQMQLANPSGGWS